MKISTEGIEITKRFFEAIEVLKLQKKIRGLQTFTNEYGINLWNMSTVRDNPESSVLKPEWLNYLHKDYGISVKWLLTGLCEMFSND